MTLPDYIIFIGIPCIVSFFIGGLVMKYSHKHDREVVKEQTIKGKRSWETNIGTRYTLKCKTCGKLTGKDI